MQRIRTVHATLAGGEMDELFKIIRNPGWTTVAEATFLLASLESINAQSAQSATIPKSLLAAAPLVNTTLAAGV